jgi:hypothetical protein
MKTWTSEDQSRLDALVAKKQEFYDKHREPLRKLVKRILDHVGKGEMSDARVNDTVLELELHADELRDLLKPFDSGQRPPTIGQINAAYPPCPTAPPGTPPVPRPAPPTDLEILTAGWDLMRSLPKNLCNDVLIEYLETWGGVICTFEYGELYHYSPICWRYKA